MPHDPAEPLTPLSLWMRKYIQEFGKWMDQPESLTPEAVQSYYDSPAYDMDMYIQPHGGWKTFNEFFARHFKPGTHPIAAIEDSRIITSPADSTFGGQWEVSTDSEVDIKGIRWKLVPTRIVSKADSGCMHSSTPPTITASMPLSEAVYLNHASYRVPYISKWWPTRIRKWPTDAIMSR